MKKILFICVSLNFILPYHFYGVKRFENSKATYQTVDDILSTHDITFIQKNTNLINALSPVKFLEIYSHLIYLSKNNETGTSFTDDINYSKARTLN